MNDRSDEQWIRKALAIVWIVCWVAAAVIFAVLWANG